MTFMNYFISIPLEPQIAMFKGLLLLSSSLKQAFPVWSLITDNSFRIIAYVERKKDIKNNTTKSLQIYLIYSE